MISILIKWICVAGMMVGLGGDAKHPIYMSVTEIEHNAKDKTLEISCKIFTNDFETSLRQNYHGLVDLLQPKDKAAMNKLVNEYIQKHFSIKLEGKPVVMQFLGYEQQEEGIMSFSQVNNVVAVKKIEITDNILYDYKNEQMSIIHVIVNGNRKSTRLINPDEKAVFEF